MREVWPTGRVFRVKYAPYLALSVVNSTFLFVHILHVISITTCVKNVRLIVTRAARIVNIVDYVDDFIPQGEI